MFDHRTTEVYYTPLPRFPSVNRDIAVVCDDGTTAGELMGCIREAGGEYLKGCEVFDVYKGANIPEGKKSVAFSLTLRSDDQTLTDAHADEAVQAILAALRRLSDKSIAEEIRLPSQAARLMRGVDIERLKTAKTFPELTEAVRGSMYFPVLSAMELDPKTGMPDVSAAALQLSAGPSPII